jgi:hypothetical protein
MTKTNEIKYLPLLDGIVSKDNIKLMELVAAEHRKYSNITFKIVEANDEKIIFGVSQGKSAAENYQTQKRLIEIVHQTFDRFFTGRKILVHANEYIQPEANQVDKAWIADKMSKYKVRLKDLEKDTGMNYSYLSQLTSGDEPLSAGMKALFWFYFKAKEYEVKYALS